ncbi:NAD(P)/FAD-dependent oxidoreductase [Roseospirillum parvum]|uniref:Glycine/D-amino acid oxidase n=1 Tax=Roseospirillum parvum TaxID=83401 RepID=A0A1G7UFH1_9PROT|nr:FAD-binding oxidoreductase [Roseospirillum parvum]SDG46346.1 Glycine/D-amino acid oxidase [Roseospirillum parvum]
MAASLLHPELRDPTRRPPTWWAEDSPPPPPAPPLDGATNCRVAVIGAGYTGLSAALELARAGVEVVVLEAAWPGWGASGRNSGMCCLGGSFRSLDALARRHGAEETRRFVRVQQEAIALVGELAETHGFDLARQGAGELAVAHRPAALAGLRDHQEALARFGGPPTALWSAEELAERHHASPDSHGALFMAGSFGLNPLRLAVGLAIAARAAGARLHGGSPVVSWRREAGRHILTTPEGELRADQVVVATNAFTPDDLGPAGRRPPFRGAYLPVLTQVIVSRPLSPTEQAAHRFVGTEPISDTRRLLTDVRLLPPDAAGGRRLLIAGPGGTRGSEADMAHWRDRMARRLALKFPAWAGIGISHAWRGPWCITSRLSPTVGCLPDDSSIWFAIGFQGVGVSLGTWSGRAVARVLSGRAAGPMAEIPAVMAAMPRPFPLAALRGWGQRMAHGLLRARDGFV